MTTPVTPYPGNSHWPANFQGGYLTGTYVGFDGSVLSGTLLITPSVARLTSLATKKTVVARPLTVTLDANGSFSILLPATDDPDITPVNYTYTIVENLTGGGGFTRVTGLPMNTTVDVTQIPTGQPSSPGTITLGPAVTSVNGQTGAVTVTATGSVADSTTASKGLVQLAGDLGGTATAPTVPALTTILSRLTAAENRLRDSVVILTYNGTTYLPPSGDTTMIGNQTQPRLFLGPVDPRTVTGYKDSAVTEWNTTSS